MQAHRNYDYDDAFLGPYSFLFPVFSPVFSPALPPVLPPVFSPESGSGLPGMIDLGIVLLWVVLLV
ncbi:hypothetical protein F4779DRAFT_596595 [Xylariaceae sp. FL0662B]|nr:hypothetical protein F4779DRAFT_596595 [Xylariaceae sp. FL0662B]